MASELQMLPSSGDSVRHELKNHSYDTRSILISAPDTHSRPFLVPIAVVQSYSDFCGIAKTLFNAEKIPCLVWVGSPNQWLIHPTLWKSLLPILGGCHVLVKFSDDPPVDEPSEVFKIEITIRFCLLDSDSLVYGFPDMWEALTKTELLPITLVVTAKTTARQLRIAIASNSYEHLLSLDPSFDKAMIPTEQNDMCFYSYRCPEAVRLSEFEINEALHPGATLYCEIDLGSVDYM